MDPNNRVLSSGSILLVHKGPLMVFYGIILLGGVLIYRVKLLTVLTYNALS